MSGGPTFGDFVTILTGGRCRTTLLQDYRVQEYRLPSPPSIKCNVLRESLSEDSQNISCATLKRRGSWVICVYLWKYFKHIGYLGDINERTVHCLVYLTAPESAVHVNPLIISSQIKSIVRRWSLQQGAAATENAMSHVSCCSFNIVKKRYELLICTQSPLPIIIKYSTF